MADTGVSDPHYNLVSVLYHALQEGDLMPKYISDAERDGNDDLAQFFREVQQADKERAQRAKDLLQRQLTR